jgi:hypothetical protein
MKRKKSDKTLRIERLDKLWSQIIKLRADGKSELSGEWHGDVIQAHHVYGKKTNALRYDLRNGIALAKKEHIYGIHNPDPSISGYYHEQVNTYIKLREGDNIFDIFAMQKNNTGINLSDVEIILKNELRRLKNE